MNVLLDWWSYSTSWLITRVRDCTCCFERCGNFGKNAIWSDASSMREPAPLRFLASTFSPWLLMLFIISRRIRENIDISLHTGVSLVLINCILQHRLSSHPLDISCSTLPSINVNPIKWKYEWKSLIKIDSHMYTHTNAHTHTRIRALHVKRVTSLRSLCILRKRRRQREHFSFTLSLRILYVYRPEIAGSPSRSGRVFP